MRKEIIFQILASVFLVVSAYFFWGQNNDFAFFFLVLSACAFFLNIRVQARARLEGDKESKSELDNLTPEP
jgi:uncharacterized membrane protein